MARVRELSPVLVGALIGLAMAAPGQSSRGSDWNMGDVFVSAAAPSSKSSFMAGEYRVFSGNGVPTGEIVGALNRDYTAGCAVEVGTGYLWTTSHFGNSVQVYDDLHNVRGEHEKLRELNVRREAFLNGRAPGAVRSVGFDAAGHLYAGITDGTNRLLKFSPSGEIVDRYALPGAPDGPAWFDIAQDQTTVYYTSGDNVIRRYDMARRAALPDFATLLDGGLHALRLLPNDQGVLVAGSIYVTRLDLTGAVITKLWLPGRRFRSLSITPDATQFWTSTQLGELYRFDIASGTLAQGPVSTGLGDVRSTCVKYEYTAAENVCRSRGSDGAVIQTPCPQY